MAVLKLKASTLMESLVAMIVIMICFVIASMIYTNIINSTNNKLKLDASLLLKEIGIKAKEENNYLDEKFETENLVVQKSVTSYKNSGNLSLLTLIAFDKNGKKIAEQKELIIVP